MVTIGTDSTLVLQPNRARLRVLMVNNSNEDIYLSPGGVAYSTAGIAVKASGGAYSDEVDNTGYIYQGVYTGISATGGKLLSVTELSRGEGLSERQ